MRAARPAQPGSGLDRRLAPAGLIVVVALAATWSWWAWQQGAYFGTVLYPGVVLLCALLALLALLAPWPLRWRASPPAAVALGALVALGLWSAASALWSPAAETAIADGQRILAYGLAFALGVWAVALLEGQARLALLPLVIAAGVAAGAVIFSALTTTGPGDLLEVDGTLDYPLGYRNANAAFFLIAVWPALGVAADRAIGWGLRGPALAVASSCIGIAMLSQSRAAIPAVAVAVVVYALLSPRRARALAWLALAVLPALVVLPAASELYEAVNDTRAAAALPELRAAGRALLGAVALATLIGFAAAWLDGRRKAAEADTGRADRVVGLGVVAALVGATVAFAVAVGDPVDWVGDRAEEFRSAGSPNLSQAEGRFTLNAGSNRYDLWRVGLDSVRDDPILGEGGGGYQYAYTRERRSEGQDARDAHNVGLEVASELGLPGLAMLLAALVGAGLGALRSRRLGPSAGSLAAIALAAAAYWLVHTSFDWFWAYPVLTAPVFALLGAACAPAMDAGPPVQPRRAVRTALAVAAALLALSAIPPFLAESYVNRAYGGWKTDLATAYDDVERAASLNRLADAPLIAEGAIASAAGDSARATAAFEEAIERKPVAWESHYFLALELARSDPARAQAELEAVRRLNPGTERLARLRRTVAAAARASERR